tara:strand:- start:82 stop:351 length:270 start_codon:yes stop_codon:yes gene_type:complete
MDNQTVKETARETLARVREESINLGISVYSDFIYLAHNDYVIHNDYKQEIDFSNYGYLEYCLFAECLNLFNNYGYDELTKFIDELEDIK